MVHIWQQEWSRHLFGFEDLMNSLSLSPMIITVIFKVKTINFSRSNVINSYNSVINIASEARADLQEDRLKALDRIDDFPSFISGLQTRFGKNHIIIQNGEDIHLSQTDSIGRSVTFYMHFQHVTSDFGCIFVNTLEHKGSNIPKSYFTKTIVGYFQKNSLISR